MPFGQATAATCRRRVLRYEGRMAPHWCLLAVISWDCWSKPLGYEFGGVNQDRVYPALCQIGFILGIETEARAEGRLRKS